MYIDHGAYCLDIGRRVRRGRRVNLAISMLSGVLLEVFGITAAIIGGAPAWVAPVFVLALCAFWGSTP